MPKIAVLFHHNHNPRIRLLIHLLAQVWQQMGLEVSLQYGLKSNFSADLLIPQIDLTIMPDDYQDKVQGFPRVVNRSLTDISKRSISRQLLQPGDLYDGSVIVKTNYNCGGLPEGKLSRYMPASLAYYLPKLLTWREQQSGEYLGRARMLKNYPIFPTLADVPRSVFTNPHLVVERFLPEQEGEYFFMRHYLFLGDKYINSRVASRSPQVKAANCEVVDVVLPLPAEVLKVRRELGMDFGKIDYTMHDGTPVILDVNQTPGVPSSPENEKIMGEFFAPAIWSLLTKPEQLGR